jgi:ubiquinone/menaquinone biosynthesis C-methylase UbiE
MTVLDIGCGMGYFSIAMARMAENTRVIALDIQERMLEIMKKRASRAGVLDRISPRLAESGSLGLGEGIDFALSFWMVHEVPDRKRLLSQVHALLKDGGRYLIVEPRIHTGNDYFRELESIIEEAGFRIIDRPPVSLSRAVLLEK